MCGFVGYWSNNRVSESVVEKMAMKIRHRGPDDTGVWVDNDCHIAMAHRRLAIIDISFAGHQPMFSPCRRYTLVYNGERRWPF